MEKNDERKDASTNRIWPFIFTPNESTTAHEWGPNTKFWQQTTQNTNPLRSSTSACRQLFLISLARIYQIALSPLLAQSSNFFFFLGKSLMFIHMGFSEQLHYLQLVSPLSSIPWSSSVMSYWWRQYNNKFVLVETEGSGAVDGFDYQCKIINIV